MSNEMRRNSNLGSLACLSLSSILVGFMSLAGCGATGDSEGVGGNDGSGDNGSGEVICSAAETRSCFSGPSGSEGVGTCVSGIETCNDDGTAWSACVGEIVPTAEVCDNDADDDCNGAVDDVADIDGDGFTTCDGDCCETTQQCEQPALVNPGAVEVVAEDGAESGDENCNGIVDEVALLCDDGLALDDADPIHAANALDICEQAGASSHGLISAAYVRGDGSAFPASEQHGLQAAFGTNVSPQLGSTMVALSTGAARSMGQANACNNFSCPFATNGSAPAGFPQDVQGCDGGNTIFDDVALELTLRAPANAKGYAFDFRFYSFEYPEWVCTEFNDQFVALVDPAPAGAINGNIAFDSMTNPVSVNIAFFDVCEGCANGTADLAGTGFDVLNDAGATDWLRTQAPVTGGDEFTIKFLIWDTGDANYDSTVLIDNFRWLAEPVAVSTGTID